MKIQKLTAALAACALLATLCGQAFADPLPGEKLKFQQLPLNMGLAPSVGGMPYPGHDEWSTARINTANNSYQGEFMADDFADNVSDSVVHVKWWGSYQQNADFNGVRDFLISFESDLPFDPAIGGSRPDVPLLNQIVTRGPLAPGSGTFTETLINGAVPEHLYQYNAELKVPFAQLKDTVYWIKIVALVDPSVDGGPINWGWHNRDWGLNNLATASPNVLPGERDIGPVIDINGTPLPVWHFQDDAVSGFVNIFGTAANPLNVQQTNYKPQNYIFSTPGLSFIDGPPGIQQFSKDLAFELYYRPVPEPSTLAMLGMGAGGLGLLVWKRRRNGRTLKAQKVVAVLAVIAICAAMAGQASADPLPGEVLKFQQLPLNNGLAPSVGGAPYPGHDEWSTARATVQPGVFIGSFMADDFADLSNDPVVHVRWWGSYDLNFTNTATAQQFLITFETDVPAGPPPSFSRPGTPLLNQIVQKGPLAPGSGTFTEKLINGAVAEHLYEYNAELKIPFAEQANTVYWLKIVALNDPAVDGGIFNWGWHNRDWGIKDPLASIPPLVSPGEGDIGPLIDPNGTPLPVWHFQDDAVSGFVNISPGTAANPINVVQTGHAPENYQFVAGAVNNDGPFGIQNFSKDLAFELYYRPVPEPSTLVLLAMGAAGMGAMIWRRRRKLRA